MEEGAEGAEGSGRQGGWGWLVGLAAGWWQGGWGLGLAGGSGGMGHKCPFWGFERAEMLHWIVFGDLESPKCLPASTDGPWEQK